MKHLFELLVCMIISFDVHMLVWNYRKKIWPLTIMWGGTLGMAILSFIRMI